MDTEQNNTPNSPAPPEGKFEFIKKIFLKIWIPSLIVVFVAGIILTLVWNGSINLRISSKQFSDATTAQDKCGNGVCGPVEKSNPNLCPKDCKGQVFQPTPDTSTTPIVSITSDKGTGSPFGIITENSPPFDDKLLDLGVKVTRYSTTIAAWGSIEKTKGTYDWSQTDSLVSATYKNNIAIFLTVRSFNSWDQGGSLTGNQKYPKDINAYAKFLKTMVERYDGDGINDAFGSPIVEYFQIENEVDGNFWDDTPEKYAQLLTISYKTIKEANPNAKVAIAGISSARGFYEFYISSLNALREKSFDIFDMHWYGKAEEYKKINADDFKAFISDLKTRLSNYGYSNIPLWMTETGTYGGENVVDAQGKLMPEQSEKTQASNLVKRYTYFISNGIDVVMWYKMIEEHHNPGTLGKPNDYFENTGLINNPANSDGLSHKKLSYYTYKKMVEVLEGSDWNNIQTIQESDGIYIYKFTKNKKPIWVAWNDNNTSKIVNLNVGNIQTVQITEAVPKYQSGKEVTDYTSAFTTLTTSGSISLGKIPVFIEETQAGGCGDGVCEEPETSTNCPEDCNICSTSTTCNSHGTCTSTGSCSCKTGYTGSTCNSCAAGYSGYPTCAIACSVNNSCASRTCYNNDVYCANNCGSITYLQTDCGPLAGTSFTQSAGDGWCSPQRQYCTTNGLFPDAYLHHVITYTYDGTCSGSSCRTNAGSTMSQQVQCNYGYTVTTPVGCTCGYGYPACDF